MTVSSCLKQIQLLKNGVFEITGKRGGRLDIRCHKGGTVNFGGCGQGKVVMLL